MEEARGETFLWNELRENFIKYFIFIPQEKMVVETAKQIKAFIEPTGNKTLQHDRPTINCNNIQTKTPPQLTRLNMENKNMEVKILRWKSYHSETTKPICTVLKVETVDKEDTDRMTAAGFPTTFLEFK